MANSETETETESKPCVLPCRLVLCGTPAAVSEDGRSQPLSAPDAALLAYLALEGPTSRQRMLALLWPDEAPDLVRNRLRQRLFALKRRLGMDTVAGTLTLSLAPTLQWPGFEHEAVERPFLGATDAAELPGFAGWLDGVRERLHLQRREQLAGAASALEQQGRLAEAIVSAEQLLALEPCQEHAHRRLMRLHYLRGDRAAALLAFDRCEQVLKDEVGAAPSAETLELLTQIDRAAAPVPKGLRRAVPATVLRPPRLIGRDAEWARIEAAWIRGDAIVIDGEAGMGKTRLLGDLLLAHTTEGELVRESARPGDEQVPYALWSRLLRTILARRGQALPAGVQRELARLLPELPQPPRPATQAQDAAARARFVGAIETTLGHAVANGLRAVALDDLHFADAASLELAQHLAGSGLRWLVAFRGAEIGPAARALVDTLTGHHRAEVIRLNPLTAKDVGELVDSLDLDAPDTAVLAAALHQRSGGNPQYLLETLKTLLQSAPGQPEHGIAQALAALPAAGPIGRLIERRLGQLSPGALKLARCAAIAGQDFSAALAAQVLEVNPLDLTEAWSELESAQVLRDGVFAHDLVHEAAARSVPVPIARELHRRVADWLQATQAAPARVATHWLGAGEELRAAPHLAEAGRAAQRTMRLREGFELLNRARQAYQLGGDLEAQCELADEVIDAATYSDDFAGARTIAQEVLQAARSEREQALACCSMANLLSHLREMEEATEVSRRALRHALAARDRATEVRARCLLADLLGEQGLSRESETTLEPLRAWVPTQGNVDLQLLLGQSSSRLLQNAGRLSAAIQGYSDVAALARQADRPHVVPQLLTHLAMSQCLAGRAEEGATSLETVLALMLQSGGESPFAQIIRVRIQTMRGFLGHYGAALAMGEQLMNNSGAGPAERDEARFYTALCHLHLGQASRAMQLSAEAGALNAGSALQMFWLELRADLSPTPAQRQAAVAAAADVLEQVKDRLRLLRAWRVMARFGESGAAIAAARSALAYAESNEMRGQQVVFQTLLAQRLAESGAPEEGLRLALAAWQLLPQTTPPHVYRGLLWQALRQVFLPHDAALAMRVAQTAADWIHHTAVTHVPPPFRDSFLRRNPVNASLLAAAAA